MPVDQLGAAFTVNWHQLIAQTISFAVVWALLYGFAYTPLRETLEARRQQMAKSLANTARINAQLAAIEAQREDLLKAARAEASRIVTDARIAARQLTEQAANERLRILAETQRLTPETTTHAAA